jgi:TATA-binding protein-associated factor
LLDPLSRAVQSPLAVVRSAAAKALSTMADCMAEVTMRHIVQAILPLVADMHNVHHRQGAIEVLSREYA